MTKHGWTKIQDPKLPFTSRTKAFTVKGYLLAGDLKLNLGVGIYSAFQSLPTMTHEESQHNLPTYSYHSEWTHALEQQKPKLHLMI